MALLSSRISARHRDRNMTLTVRMIGNGIKIAHQGTRDYRWLAAVTLAGLVIMRLVYLRNTHVIYDEFQHLHAAYLVALGQTPYIDFFEHHTPLFYYLAAPFLRVFL